MNTQAINRVSEHSELIINDEPRRFEDFPIGSVSHQGDVILVAVDGLPDSAKTRTNRQVADGNTQGSRHVLVGGEIFDCTASDVAARIFRATKKRVDERYIGPVFQGGNLTHPEHGDQSFPDDCTIAVVYQRSLDSEMREQRVLD